MTAKNPALIVLAAGFSRRFGEEDKLQYPIDGTPLLQKTLETFSATMFGQRILVVNSDSGDSARMGRKLGFEIGINHYAEAGMGSSISAGVRLVKDAAGAMVALGDMPFISPQTINSLTREFLRRSCIFIVAPSFKGERGHPVIFPSSFFEPLEKLNEDHGAREVINSNLDLVAIVDTDDPGVLQDVDTKRCHAQI